ncbi:MAG: DNA polymerase IV [Deltaproteobacteria bacterium]|nr:DNA polymerase IV [Deltaproteobacteria bacterium]
MDPARAILHLDLDAFYASVEQLDDPSLRGRPVIVGGTSGRGVVCAASYEARRFGVHSAMPTARARKLCPGGVYLAPRFDRYGELSDRIFGIYRRFTPLVEPLSLDEAFLDVTRSRALHGSGADIARAVKRLVREETGLAVSAGVAEVKLAAKIATDLGKPDGLVVVPEGGVAAFLAPLPVSRLWGVGQVTEEALARGSIRTIGDLAAADPAALSRLLGGGGGDLQRLARGEDAREVVPDAQARSIGAEDTFEEDRLGEEALLPQLREQAERVGRRLRGAGLTGKTVTVKVKYADFRSITRRCTLPAPTDDGRAIYDAARAQLERADLSRPVRLVGVAVSGFPGEGSQLDLFAAAEPVAARRRALNAALDALSERFGSGAVRPASAAGERAIRWAVKPRGKPQGEE